MRVSARGLVGLARSQQRIAASFLDARLFSIERAGKSVKPGAALVIDNEPHKVVKITQGKRGKGGGFVRATLKSLISNSVFEKTFTSDENVEHADLERDRVQYSWEDSDCYVFMNSDTFEEIKVPKDVIDDREWLSEGLDIKLLKFRGKVIGAQLPEVCEYSVEAVDLPGRAAVGNTMVCRLSCGAELAVPAFIKEGSRIKVNTVTREYVEKAE